MPRFYPVEIERPCDGRRYRGEYTLLMGGRLRVRCFGYPAMTVEIGAGAEPKPHAQRALLLILDAHDAEQAAWRERQDEERARLRGPRPRRAKPDDGPTAPA